MYPTRRSGRNLLCFTPKTTPNTHPLVLDGLEQVFFPLTFKGSLKRIKSRFLNGILYSLLVGSTMGRFHFDMAILPVLLQVTPSRAGMVKARRPKRFFPV